MSDNQLVPPGLAYLADNIISRQNILGAPGDARARWAKGLTFSSASDTLFFSGCGYQYTHQIENMTSLMRKLDASAVGTALPTKLAGLQKKLGLDGIFNKVMGSGDSSGAAPLISAVKVLQHFGIEMRYLGKEEPCCGGLLYYAGMQDEFSANSQKLVDKLKSAGIRRIISIVPSCTYTLRDLVPRFTQGEIEVKHFSEIAAELVKDKGLVSPRPMKVTYHDPCQTGRYLGLTAEPRQILQSIKGIELVEPESTAGEWSTCCGGGGGFEAVFPELSEILAVNRVKELVATGAEAIVTQCPGCIIQLEAGLKKLGKENIAVLDLAQVLAMAAGV